MRRLLILTGLSCLCLSSAALAATSNGATSGSATSHAAVATGGRSCRYTSPPPAFPDVQRLTASGAGCADADRVAQSIQRYWKRHGFETAPQSFPATAERLVCRYRELHELMGDPYFHAVCRHDLTRVSMDLTS